MRLSGLDGSVMTSNLVYQRLGLLLELAQHAHALLLGTPLIHQLSTVEGYQVSCKRSGQRNSVTKGGVVNTEFSVQSYRWYVGE